MIKINIVENFNGTQLVKELEEAGVVLYENIASRKTIVKEANGDVYIPSTEEYSALAQSIADLHSPVFNPPTIEQKLNSAGLTLNELKEALGL